MQLHQVTRLPQATLSVSSLHYFLQQTRKIGEAFPTTFTIPAPKRMKYQNSDSQLHNSYKQSVENILQGMVGMAFI